MVYLVQNSREIVKLNRFPETVTGTHCPTLYHIRSVQLTKEYRNIYNAFAQTLRNIGKKDFDKRPSATTMDENTFRAKVNFLRIQGYMFMTFNVIDYMQFQSDSIQCRSM